MKTLTTSPARECRWCVPWSYFSTQGSRYVCHKDKGWEMPIGPNTCVGCHEYEEGESA